MRHQTTLPVSLVALALSACFTPQPVLRLTPRAPSDSLVWVGGVPVMTVKGERSRVAIAFARDQDATLAFRVEVQNLGEKTLLLDSRNFSFRACRRMANQPERCGVHTRVRDPESEILALDLQRSRDQAHNANQMAFFTVLSLLDAAGMVAGVATGNHRAADGFGDNLRHDVSLAQHAEMRENQQLSSYAMSRALWETAAFRKTTTPPGSPVAGMVFVDRDLAASAVMVYATIDGERYTFPFDQILISPTAAKATDQAPPRLRRAGR